MKTVLAVSACSVVIVCGNLRLLPLLLQTCFLFLFQPTVATTRKLAVNVEGREVPQKKLFFLRGGVSAAGRKASDLLFSDLFALMKSIKFKCSFYFS